MIYVLQDENDRALAHVEGPSDYKENIRVAYRSWVKVVNCETD